MEQVGAQLHDFERSAALEKCECDAALRDSTVSNTRFKALLPLASACSAFSSDSLLERMCVGVQGLHAR